MSERRHHDVVIIGAGSVGIPAALAMAKSGRRVLVVDRFASPGQGSNKAAIGGVRATHSDPAKIRLCLRSLEIISTWEESCGHNIEWNTGGYTFVTYRESEEKALRELIELQRGYGLNIDWHDREDMLRIVPDLNPDGLIGGTYSPEDGNCSTLLAGHAFYEEALKAGARFVFQERVTAVLTRSGRVHAVKTDKAEYGADVVINAAGAWAREVGSLNGLDLAVQPDSHEAGITEPVAPFFEPMVVDIRPAEGSQNYYFSQLRSGQVIFCITPSPSFRGFDRRETSAFLPMVARRMVGLMPRLANIRVRRMWRGLYPMTPDGSPLVGWAREIEGYLIAAGMCGQGFMLGPGLGELLDRMVSREAPTPEDRETLDILSPYRSFEGREVLK
jgi:sarcosine oxidase subunit beta